jgi:D-beta-D-heptose 7-phosphate kinase/D-beta-D-heptose 1-phosphate adenosyltransferase
MSPTMKDRDDTLLSRLLTVEDAARRACLERLRGSKIVFTNGVFDVLHRGHLEYLRAAAALGNLLFVGLNSDNSARRLKGPRRPLVNQEDRAAALSALRYVNGVILFEEDTPFTLIEAIRPHILVKGGDYREDEIVGAEFVKRNGGTVVTIPFFPGYSTSRFIDDIVERYADKCLKI